jgi:hypothetical protein
MLLQCVHNAMDLCHTLPFLDEVRRRTAIFMLLGALGELLRGGTAYYQVAYPHERRWDGLFEGPPGLKIGQPVTTREWYGGGEECGVIVGYSTTHVEALPCFARCEPCVFAVYVSPQDAKRPPRLLNEKEGEGNQKIEREVGSSFSYLYIVPAFVHGRRPSHVRVCHRPSIVSTAS